MFTTFRAIFMSQCVKGLGRYFELCIVDLALEIS